MSGVKYYGDQIMGKYNKNICYFIIKGKKYPVSESFVKYSNFIKFTVKEFDTKEIPLYTFSIEDIRMLDKLLISNNVSCNYKKYTIDTYNENIFTKDEYSLYGKSNMKIKNIRIFEISLNYSTEKIEILKDMLDFFQFSKKIKKIISKFHVYYVHFYSYYFRRNHTLDEIYEGIDDDNDKTEEYIKNKIDSSNVKKIEIIRNNKYYNDIYKEYISPNLIKNTVKIYRLIDSKSQY